LIRRRATQAAAPQMPIVLAMTGKLSPRIIHLIETLCTDWRHLDGRIETVSDEIKTLSEQDDRDKRLMTVPGIGPIISTSPLSRPSCARRYMARRSRTRRRS
jgi:transposase